MEVVDVGGARSLRSSVSPIPVVSWVSIGGAPCGNCGRRQSQTAQVAESCKNLGGVNRRIFPTQRGPAGVRCCYEIWDGLGMYHHRAKTALERAHEQGQLLAGRPMGAGPTSLLGHSLSSISNSGMGTRLGIPSECELNIEY